MYISTPLKGGRRHQGVSPFYNRLNKISPTISSRSGNHFLQVPKDRAHWSSPFQNNLYLLCSFFPDTQYSAACCSQTRKAVVARNGRTFRATCLNTQFSRVNTTSQYQYRTPSSIAATYQEQSCPVIFGRVTRIEPAGYRRSQGRLSE